MGEKMTRPARAPAVRAVVVHQGRYLLAQHHNRLPEKIGKWGLPGGRIETSDADLRDALHRELYEEFVITADILGFVAMYTYRDRSHHIYLARPHTVELQVNVQEILSVAWLTLEEVTALHAQAMLHTGFELQAIRASLLRYSHLLTHAEINAKTVSQTAELASAPAVQPMSESDSDIQTDHTEPPIDRAAGER